MDIRRRSSCREFRIASADLQRCTWDFRLAQEISDLDEVVAGAGREAELHPVKSAKRSLPPQPQSQTRRGSACASPASTSERWSGYGIISRAGACLSHAQHGAAPISSAAPAAVPQQLSRLFSKAGS